MRALRRHSRLAGRATNRRPAPRLPFLAHRRPSGMSGSPQTEQAEQAPAGEAPAREAPQGKIGVDLDLAAHRVRAAGGPTDTARYTCACGCVFDAPVSATVSCPHCGGEQAW